MTDKEWKQVEQRMTPPIGYVRLNIDGYMVTIVTVEEKPLHYCLGVYVNGEIRVEWIDQDCEVRRKFYRHSTRSLLDTKGRQMLKKERKSVREAVLKKCTYEDYTPYWGSFKSLKSHLVKNCTLIEFARKEPQNDT